MMAGMFTLTLNGFLLVLRTRRSLMLTSNRLFWVLLCRMWSGWADARALAKPQTVIRWRRTGFRQAEIGTPRKHSAPLAHSAPGSS